jgi:FG-GAP repeat
LWEEIPFSAIDGATGAHFGSSVSVSGDSIVVGAWAEGSGEPGAAHVFESFVCEEDECIEDNIEPVAMTQDITVPLDTDGGASVTAAEIDNGSTDNCRIDSLSVSPAFFGCSEVGENAVVLTVTDGDANANTAEAVVTVEDDIVPQLTIPADVTVMSERNQTIVEIGEATASDNCSVGISNDAPAVFPLGTTIVTWTAADANDNTSTGTQIVIVLSSMTLNEDAIKKLAPFADESKRITKAITHIEKSLESSLWIDGGHLNEKHGHKVFEHTHHAVLHLVIVLKHPDGDDSANQGGNNENVSDAARSAAESTIGILVNTVRVLSTDLYDEVSAMPVINPSNQSIVENFLAKALKLINKANAEKAIGKNVKAIKNYMQAWKKTVQAKKIALMVKKSSKR